MFWSPWRRSWAHLRLCNTTFWSRQALSFFNNVHFVTVEGFAKWEQHQPSTVHCKSSGLLHCWCCSMPLVKSLLAGCDPDTEQTTALATECQCFLWQNKFELPNNLQLGSTPRFFKATALLARCLTLRFRVWLAWEIPLQELGRVLEMLFAYKSMVSSCDNNHLFFFGRIKTASFASAHTWTLRYSDSSKSKTPLSSGSMLTMHLRWEMMTNCNLGKQELTSNAAQLTLHSQPCLPQQSIHLQVGTVTTVLWYTPKHGTHVLQMLCHLQWAFAYDYVKHSHNATAYAIEATPRLW